MAEQTIISWNVTNWITIVLMVILAYFIFSVLGSLIASVKG